MAVNVRKLETDIVPGSILLIDTNVVIAYLEGEQDVTDAAKLLIDEWVHAGRNQAFVSAVSAMEILVGPLRAKRPIANYLDFLQRFPNLTCVSLDLHAAQSAASIRARSSLKPPDALIVGTAVAVAADIIVTNDDALAKKSPMPVALLSDYLNGEDDRA